MWLHPDASSQDITEQYPEIFSKYDLLYFDLPGDLMADFLKSTNYLDASRKNKDLGKLFSAIQRARRTGKHKTFDAYLKNRKIAEALVKAVTLDEVKEVLTKASDKYNDKYGMRKKIRDFYQQYMDDESRKKLLNSLARPASHKPGQYSDADGQVRVRIDFLLDRRDEDTHAASYLPLPEPDTIPYQHETRPGDPGSVWLISLTFDDIYEITRGALAQYWLEQYEDYWNGGGEQIIKKTVSEIQARCDDLNAKNDPKS